jgi:hypothetical protein
MKELVNTSGLHSLAGDDEDQLLEAAMRVCYNRLLFLTLTGFLDLGTSIVAEEMFSVLFQVEIYRSLCAQRERTIILV